MFCVQLVLENIIGFLSIFYTVSVLKISWIFTLQFRVLCNPTPVCVIFTQQMHLCWRHTKFSNFFWALSQHIPAGPLHTSTGYRYQTLSQVISHSIFGVWSSKLAGIQDKKQSSSSSHRSYRTGKAIASVLALKYRRKACRPTSLPMFKSRSKLLLEMHKPTSILALWRKGIIM